MFTGIIEAVGSVYSLQQQGGDVRLGIQAGTLHMGDVKLGDSIATNGVCLTVVDFGKDWYVADVSLETLNRSALSHWKPGVELLIEYAACPARFPAPQLGHLLLLLTPGVLTRKKLQPFPPLASWKPRVVPPRSASSSIHQLGA